MLTQPQIDQFFTRGYLVVEDLLDSARLSAIRAEYASLLDGIYADWQAAGRIGPPVHDDFQGKLLTAYRAGLDWFQPMDISLPNEQVTPDTPFHFGPAVFDMVTAPRILDIMEQLLGPEISSNPIQHVRIKPPATDLRDGEVRAHITATDWHQDRAVTLAEADGTDMVTCWLAITDATIENGCLQVQPLPPDPKMLPHCPKTQTAIADPFIDAAGAVPLPVKAGGGVLFHPLTPHASLVNRTDEFRWSFDLRYHVTGQNSGRTQFPEFVARSRQAPESVLTDWRAWRQMWEDARLRLSAAPHIEQHRWRSTSPYCA